MAQAIYPPRNVMEDIIQQQTILQRPEVVKMLDLDRLMANILSRSDMSPDERLREYEKAVLQFRAVRDDILLNGLQLRPPPTLTQSTLEPNPVEDRPKLQGKRKRKMDSDMSNPLTPPYVNKAEPFFQNVTSIRDYNTDQRNRLSTEPINDEIQQEFIRVLSNQNSAFMYNKENDEWFKKLTATRKRPLQVTDVSEHIKKIMNHVNDPSGNTIDKTSESIYAQILPLFKKSPYYKVLHERYNDLKKIKTLPKASFNFGMPSSQNKTPQGATVNIKKWEALRQKTQRSRSDSSATQARRRKNKIKNSDDDEDDDDDDETTGGFNL